MPNKDQRNIIVMLLYVLQSIISKNAQIENNMDIENKIKLASRFSLFLNKTKNPNNKIIIAGGMCE
jgi:hypothetical protein